VNTPDWSKAPIDATNYGTDTPNWREGWYKLENGEWFVYWDGSDGTEKGWCEAAASLKSRPERESSLIPRPTQWRGPQDGLPPVGCIVERKLKGSNLNRLIMRVTYASKDIVCGEVLSDKECCNNLGRIVASDVILYEFECAPPTQSDRDRAIEEMGAAVERDHRYAAWNKNIDQSCAIRFAIEALYDAGYRKP